MQNFLLVVIDPTGNTEQAMLAAREQGKCGWSDPIMALITLEIFLLALRDLMISN